MKTQIQIPKRIVEKIHRKNNISIQRMLIFFVLKGGNENGKLSYSKRNTNGIENQ